MSTSTTSTAQYNADFAGALVHGLTEAGVRHAVVSPGSRSTPLVLALASHSAVTVHVVLDERSAGFVALGIGRATQAPAVVVSTSGTAAANYLPAVIEASQARVPLVVLTADRPPELQGCGAPQTMDQTRLFGEYSRWFLGFEAPNESTEPHWVAGVGSRAVARSLSSAPGPVHLNVPFREPVWSSEANAVSPPDTSPVVIQGHRMIDEHHVAQLADRMSGKTRGVIVCGPRAPITIESAELARAVSRLATALNWPVLAETTSGLRFGPHAQTHLVSTADALLRARGWAEGVAPEIVLRIGQTPTSKVVNQWMARYAKDRTIIVDPDAVWHDMDGLSQARVACDPVQLMDALAERVEAAENLNDGIWLERWRGADRAAMAVIRDHLTGVLWEGGVARSVAHSLKDGSLLHVASSMPIRDLDAFSGTAHSDICVHANRGVNGIDGTLSTAVGEALSWHRGPVLCLVGDLAFLHDVGGLAAASANNADVTFVVVNNGGGGIFEYLPIFDHPTAFERFFLTPQLVDLASLCDAYRVRHVAVDTSAALADVLDNEIGGKGTTVIEVTVDRTANVESHQAVWSAIVSELDGGTATS